MHYTMHYGHMSLETYVQFHPTLSVGYAEIIFSELFVQLRRLLDETCLSLSHGC